MEHFMSAFFKTFGKAVLFFALAGALPLWAIDPAPESGAAEPSPAAESHDLMPSGGSYLGVDGETVTPERVAALKLKEQRGVEVCMVDEDAPAGKAGIKEQDVIMEFNGVHVQDMDQLRRLIHDVPPGQTVTLGIIRGGQPLTLAVQLGDRKADITKQMLKMRVEAAKQRAAMAKQRAAMAKQRADMQKFRPNFGDVRVMPAMPPMPAMPAMPDIEMPAFDFVLQSSPRAGILVENLTPQLGDYFGVKNGEGVLVRSVEKGSPAESAGIKAGDIIVRVEKERIASRGDWRMALRAHSSGGKVALGIVREKREQIVPLVLPARKSSDSSRLNHRRFPDVEIHFDPDQFDMEVQKLLHDPNFRHALLEAQQAQRDLGRAGQDLNKELNQLRRQLQDALR
jgi:membrane-associated protease RseP (regulator of RpoE activity)